ncbi:cytochrome P450 [Mycena alexandri]|uniref:Cytochrome P450 n=1 Tax=Mycena alexandri TaxID=1745969 RepID=A0AAD6SU86_9AGAR|nr:cytochrome P450 [Mycena alexandri]
MGILSKDSVSPLVTAACALSFVAIATSSFRKWMRTKKPYAFIPGPNPSSAVGYLLDLHSTEALPWHFNIPEEFGHVARLKGGLAGADALYITDPAALNAILIRQQAWFPESTEFAGLFGIIHCGDGVASVQGREHKKQRKYMDVLFTASRVSKLTPMFYQVTSQLQSKITNALAGKPPGQVLDMLDYLTRAALEIIGTAGIGHTFNSFDDKSEAFDEFHGAITSVLPLASRLFLVLPFLESWRKIQPVWLRRTLASIATFPWPAAKRFRSAVDTMHPVYVQLYNARKKALEEGGSAALADTAAGGKDLITSMIQANWDADEGDKMSDGAVLANMSSIVHGGQETTSSSLARFLSIVAEDTDLQQRLRAELQEAKAKKAPGEDLDFNELERLPLLDAVVREMLRIYSPVTFVWRQTIKDVMVPLTYPIRSTIAGEEVKELLIKEGTTVYLGLSSANRSTAIWGPDAAEFKPERWLKRTQVESKLPGTYSGMMSFLSGSKVCPGKTFAILEMKLVLSVLLLAFSFEPIPEPIDWKMGITLEPRVRGREKEGVQVPVRVTIL